MKNYRSRLASSLVPYVGGEQPTDRSYIKLNTNENPFTPSPAVRAAIAEQVDLLQLYPSITSRPLQEAIAATHSLDISQVHLGNGSDEILAFCFAAFFSGKKLYAPDLTYSFYPTYAQLFGVDYHTIPLKDDFTIDVDALAEAPGAIIFANPNAPTSLAMAPEDIRRLCEATHARGEVIIVDEAYAAFNTEDALPLIAAFDNLIITRTFSKAHALAGLRVGVALAQPHLISAIADVKDSFNTYPVDRLACAAARAAVLDTDYFNQRVSTICATRDRCREELVEMGMEVPKSCANFLFVRNPYRSGKEMLDLLRSHGILVRHLSNPRIADYLRISIGTDEQMDQVLAVYRMAH